MTSRSPHFKHGMLSGGSMSRPQCGFSSNEIGNKLTEDEQWAKLNLVKEIAEEVWGE